MTKAILALNCIIAICLWAPSWHRMYRRKSAADYSIVTFLLILWLQLSNMGLAIAEKSSIQTLWFGLNGVIVAVTLGMVLWFRRGYK